MTGLPYLRALNVPLRTSPRTLSFKLEPVLVGRTLTHGAAVLDPLVLPKLERSETAQQWSENIGRSRVLRGSHAEPL